MTLVTRGNLSYRFILAPEMVLTTDLEIPKPIALLFCREIDSFVDRVYDRLEELAPLSVHVEDSRPQNRARVTPVHSAFSPTYPQRCGNPQPELPIDTRHGVA